MTTTQTKEAGVCPNCTSDNLKYNKTDLDFDEAIRYFYTCTNCKFEGCEVFNLVFDAHYDEGGNKL